MLGVRQVIKCSLFIHNSFMLIRLKQYPFFPPIADEEFDELCFEFGLELDEIVCVGCLFF